MRKELRAGGRDTTAARQSRRPVAAVIWRRQAQLARAGGGDAKIWHQIWFWHNGRAAGSAEFFTSGTSVGAHKMAVGDVGLKPTYQSGVLPSLVDVISGLGRAA